MKHTIFFKVFTLITFSIVFISCDKDFNSLGADFIENQHFSTSDMPGQDFGIKVTNHKLGAVESWNLPVNHLGISDDPNFGKTRANFATQLLLSEDKPTINTNAVIDSVVLTVPYYSKLLSTDSDGKNTYRLDSISTTNSNATVFDKIDLRVYESNYYLRDYDGAAVQKYYSDQDADFDGYKNTAEGILNNSANTLENSNFVPSPKEYVKYKVDNMVEMPHLIANIETRQSPRMRFHLKNSFFQTKIIDAARNAATSSNFVNNNAFKSYFRGLYFQVQDAATGHMMALDFSKGNVTIYYKQDVTDYDAVTNPTPTREMKAMILNMSGARMVNTITNTPPTLNPAPNTTAAFADGSTIYLRGGEGYVSYIDLFQGTELQDLKNKKVMVNDASLYFTIDAAQMTDAAKMPRRIYIYDAETYAPLYDYYFDQTTSSTDDKLKKYVHGGILETITSSDGLTKKYRFRVRLTEHVSTILREEGTTKKNVRLGVAITESISYPTFVELKTQVTINGKEIKKVPIATVMNAQSAVIHGTDGTDDQVRFKIFYTKPN